MNIEKAVLSLLDSTPKILKDLVRTLGKSRPRVSKALHRLEMQGDAKAIRFEKVVSTGNGAHKQAMTGWIKETPQLPLINTRREAPRKFMKEKQRTLMNEVRDYVADFRGKFYHSPDPIDVALALGIKRDEAETFLFTTANETGWSPRSHPPLEIIGLKS